MEEDTDVQWVLFSNVNKERVLITCCVFSPRIRDMEWGEYEPVLLQSSVSDLSVLFSMGGYGGGMG